MGEIVGAGLLAHVPTIVLPDEQRRELNNGNESTLYTGLHKLRRDVFDVLKPDLVIVFDSHWFTTVEFVITSAKRRLGYFTSEELPRGMSSVPYDAKGDPTFATLVGAIADATPDCWITPIDNEHLPIQYATTNFFPFLQGDEAWLSVSTCQTAEPEDFATVGRVIAAAIERSDRRVVLIASGALSHTFRSLRTLRQHEAADEEHIISSEARRADHTVIDALLSRRSQERARRHAGVREGEARGPLRALSDDGRRARWSRLRRTRPVVLHVRKRDRHGPDPRLVRPARDRLDG